MDYKYKTLVIGAKAASEEAKIQLLDHLKPLMLSAIRRYGRGMEREDLMQEARLAVLEGIALYDESKGIPFLLYIKSKVYFHIHNLTRNRRPTSSLNTPVNSAEAKEYVDLLPDEEADPTEDILKREQILALREALERLTSRQRYVIDQHYYLKRNLKSIAGDIGLSYKTVLRDKKKAVEILANLLEP
ncbi:MAG TPA: sigma-70 family RNA polymerase sigma factor [Bacillota bacterium]|nr:sigma-70 family RNA polymerase sigma factor [Bacillota bacterium]